MGSKFDFITDYRLIYITLRIDNCKNKTKQYYIKNNNMKSTENYLTNLTKLLEPLTNIDTHDPEELNRLICTNIKKAATNNNKELIHST